MCAAVLTCVGVFTSSVQLEGPTSKDTQAAGSMSSTLISVSKYQSPVQESLAALQPLQEKQKTSLEYLVMSQSINVLKKMWKVKS